MKLRKGIILILFLFLAIAITSAMNTVKAATGNMQLNIKMLRRDGYGYQIANGTKNVWKIYKTSNSQYETIYCLKGGPGFGSSDFATASPSATTYGTYFDLKDPDSIPSTYKNALPDTSSDDYEALLWILDNIYVLPKDNASSTERTEAAEQKQILLDAAADYAVETGNPDISSDGYEFELLTDDDIDAVQQLAIWYYTNPSGDYHVNTFEFWLNAVQDTDGSYTPLSDDWTFTDGWERQAACQALFYYLVETPQQSGFSYDYRNSDLRTSPVNIADTSVTVTTQGSRIIVGPYRINETRDIEYTLEGTFTDGNNREITDVILLNSQQQQVSRGTTLKDLVGQNFYISIPASTNTDTITFDIEGSFFITTTEYWSVTNPGSTDQPVVLIEKEKVSFNDSKIIENTPEEPEKEFDLALRKFISSVKDGNDNDVPLTESRVPRIASSELDRLENNQTTTANKVHTKDPVPVEKGYKVTYTIRIYNEGELDGYATEITDHLPDGLTFITNSTINQRYGWTNPSGDGKTITTNYLQNTRLDAFDGTNLDYVDIQIECEVTADVATDNKTLKNIAEITGHRDENGNTAVNDTDRDSQPGNVDLDRYGNTSQQDDDDFEDLILPGRYFDLSLRKFITVIDGTTGEVTHQREPNVDVSPLLRGETTAIYNHDKTPIRVSNGDEVIYTIRVYNEGQIDGYVTEITDHLPSQLEFIEGDELNQRYGWEVSPDGRTVTTDITSPNTTNSTNRDEIYADRTTDSDKVLLKAFDGQELDYIDVQIKCRVKDDTGSYQKITNIAEISDFTDSEGAEIEDIDSQKADEDNVEIPSDAELPTYKDPEIESGADYIPGEQDDDDFEKLVLIGEEGYFDLSLRKFITNVNDRVIDREPKVDTTPLVQGQTTAIYNHPKTPIGVSEGDIVTYTIRVYNEGRQDGYVTEITDHLPSQLEYIVDDELNARYGWQISSDGRTVTTDITSPDTALSASRDSIYADRTTDADKVLLKAFDDGEDLDYIDVQIRCRVKTGIDLYQKITNIAEISDFTDSEGSIVEDIDSQKADEDGIEIPSDEELPTYKDPEIESGVEYIPGEQDDDDFEKLVLQKFDLALRKFITNVNGNDINSRVPVFNITEDGNYEYVHPKDPVGVANGNTVIYTLRIFNEGNVAGYASEIKDDLPEGLEFLPEHEINTTYRWVMYREDGTQTTNVVEASYIKTDYLSKEQEKNAGDNLIDAFNPETMTMPDYKDIQIAFKVTEPNTSDRIIINTAEITDDSDEYGNPVEDVDSTPDNDVDGEDDIDIEKIKVLYFDLSLKKWVTESIVTYNGQTTVTQTGNTENDDPETPAKVEIRGSRISKTTVKFKFKIKVTNEGEIAGYVKELIDYVPEGLEFHAEDNPLWREEDGKILTDQLKDTLLQPGESATVEIILTWINSTDNLGEKVNWAEIYEDDNEYDSPDIDSTPGNNEHGEDDIDEAPVILAVVTGSAPTYITLVLASVSMMAGGIFLIKKFVI